MPEWISVTIFEATPENPKETVGKLISTTFKKLHLQIQKPGFSWSPASLIDNYRVDENFLLADVVACDIDEGVSPEEAEKRMRAHGYMASITLSKSHNKIKNEGKPSEKPAGPRLRIVLPLNEAARSSAVYLATLIKLRKIFPELDSTCLNPGRLFFASTGEGESILIEDGKPFKIVNTSRDYEALKASLTKKTIDKRNVSQPPNVLKSLVQHDPPAHTQWFLQNAHTGLAGEFNVALNKAAYELSRSGFSKDVALEMLQKAAPQSFDSTDLSTFESGYTGGQEKGFYKGVVVENGVPQPLLSKEQMILVSSKKLFDELWPDRYVRMIDRMGSIRTYEVTSENTLRTIFQEKIISDAVVELSKHGFPVSPRKTIDLVGYWASFLKEISENQPLLLFKSDQRLCFNRTDFDPAPGPTPRFDNFISRIKNGEELMAFLYSLFLPESDRQQYVWIWGSGGDGKGAIARFLRLILGSGFCSERAPSSQNTDKHWTSGLLGKRLAVFPDTNATTFVRTDLFMELTGGDPTKIEEKFKQSFTTLLNVKFLFLSNSIPQISNQKSDKRRAIVCHISELKSAVDPNYENDLFQERAAVFHKCKMAYEKLVVGNGPIKVDNEYLRDVTDDYESPIEGIFKRHFKVKEGAKLTPDQVLMKVQSDLRDGNFKFGDLKAWMERSLSVVISRKIKEDNTRYFYGITLLTDFEAANTELTSSNEADDYIPPFRDPPHSQSSNSKDDFDFDDDFEGLEQ